MSQPNECWGIKEDLELDGRYLESPKRSSERENTFSRKKLDRFHVLALKPEIV